MGRITQRLRLFGGSSDEECNTIRGDGWGILKQKISEAIEDDGFLFILIIGERGKGKSTLALNILQYIYGKYELVKKAIIFTMDDFDSIVQSKDNALRAEDGRIRAVMWDDMGLHFSTYKWFTPHERLRLTEFIENFQSVREDVAIIVGTVVEAEMLPPKIRGTVNHMIDCIKRGKAKLFGYRRYLWFKTWKVIGELTWSKTDPELYIHYRKMKRKAHRAKEKARIISRTKLAKVYAELLRSIDLDPELLYGLGIVDKDGHLTPFGQYVLKKANIDEEYILMVTGNAFTS